ncbi:MAG: T9SS type A sorting domain-containing protein [Bacteroidia bacterium]|nr:T9SS type A sorting domain-containing protein [Bacteroidia bacterium]
MKYNLLLFLFLLSYPGLHAQNWEIINPDRDYFYSYQGAPYAAFHILSIERDSQTTIYHNYVRPTLCTSGVFLEPQVFITEPSRYDSLAGHYTFLNNNSDSIYFKIRTRVGDSFLMMKRSLGADIRAVHLQTDWVSVLGVMDSVKTFEIIDDEGSVWSNKAFSLSKTHGLISFFDIAQFGTSNFTKLDLWGATNPMIGEQMLRASDIWDFQAGDLYQYHYNSSWDLNSWDWSYRDIWDQWDILSRDSTENIDSIVYQIQVWRIDFDQKPAFPTGNRKIDQSIDTIRYAVSTRCIYPGELDSLEGYKFKFTDSWTTTGGLFYYNYKKVGNEIIPIRSHGVWWNSQYSCYFIDPNYYEVIDKPGIGGPLYGYRSGRYGSITRNLQYYRKGNQNYGNYLDMDSIYLINNAKVLNNEELFDSDLVIFPNPIRERLHIKGSSGISMLEIFDLKGALVKKISIQPNESVSLKALDSGLYIYKLEDSQGHRRRGKFFKE